MSENVVGYYDQAAEREWGRLVTTSRVEYFITLKVLFQIIGNRTQLNILDLGGGPGRYAIELSKQMHQVTLVDLSQSNLALAKQKAEAENVQIARIIHASAVNLQLLPSNSFDLVLSMGPMYHLTEDADLACANAELIRVMKPGATALVAFITKLAVLRDVLARGPERLIEYEKHYNQVMDIGVVIQPPESGFTDLRMFNASEIRPLMTDAGFECDRLIGCEGPMNLRLYNAVNELDAVSRNKIFESIIKFSEWPTLLDSSDHLLFVGRKPSMSVAALLSEASLSDWNRPEEEKAWSYLQRGNS